MQNYIYGSGYRSFDEDWLPHIGCSDTWRIFGMFAEPQIPEATYSFSVSVNRVQAGVGSFTAVKITIKDLLHSKLYSRRWKFLTSQENKDNLHIDENSILFEEFFQLLMDPGAFAFRTINSEFRFDLRVERSGAEVWFGDDGRLPITASKNRFMYQCILPQMPASGKFYLGDSMVNLVGNVTFLRHWGKMPIRRAQVHWEQFYLFLENGDEMLLYNFPYGKYRTGLWMPKDDSAVVCNDFSLESIEYTEVGDWRFSTSWKLTIPQFPMQSLYLVPMIDYQFHLPVCRPVLGIYDEHSKLYGYAFAELMPGARNEISRIGLKLYRKT